VLLSAAALHPAVSQLQHLAAKLQHQHAVAKQLLHQLAVAKQLLHQLAVAKQLLLQLAVAKLLLLQLAVVVRPWFRLLHQLAARAEQPSTLVRLRPAQLFHQHQLQLQQLLLLQHRLATRLQQRSLSVYSCLSGFA